MQIVPVELKRPSARACLDLSALKFEKVALRYGGDVHQISREEAAYSGASVHMGLCAVLMENACRMPKDNTAARISGAHWVLYAENRQVHVRTSSTLFQNKTRYQYRQERMNVRAL